MDPIERALLDAVCADPAADDPREVYADWLMSRGDPRGEYIALALKRAGVTRMLQLERESGGRWVPPLLARVATPSAGFARGFVEALTIDAAAWIEHGDALVRESPLRELQLMRARDLAAALRTPATRRMTSLALGGDRPFWPEELRGLADVPPLTALAHLNLSATSVHLFDDDMFGQLCELHASPVSLRASRITLGGAGLTMLAVTTLGARLEALHVSSELIDDACARPLAALPALRELRVQHSAMTAAGVGALLATAPQLADLDFVGVRLDPAAIAAWRSPRLQSLALYGRDVRDEQLEALCAIPPAHLPALRRFRLDSANVNARGVKALVESALFAQLDSIAIGQSPFNKKAHRALEGAFGARINLARRN